MSELNIRILNAFSEKMLNFMFYLYWPFQAQTFFMGKEFFFFFLMHTKLEIHILACTLFESPIVACKHRVEIEAIA